MKLVRGGASTWDQATKKPKPRKGDIVMFNGADHVALATGVTDAAGTHVYSILAAAGHRVRRGRLQEARQGQGPAAARPTASRTRRSRRWSRRWAPAPWSPSGRRRGSAARDDPMGAGGTAAPPPGPRAALEHGLGERRPAAPRGEPGPHALGRHGLRPQRRGGGERPPRRRARRGGREPSRARVGGAGDRRAGLGDRRLPRRGRRQLDGAGAGARTARPGPGARASRRTGRRCGARRRRPARPRRCASCSRGRCWAYRRAPARGDQPGGVVTDVQELEAGGDCFADGQGRLGFAAYDERTEARSWVTVGVGGGAREVIALEPASAWALDIPLGMDARGRPYGYRQGALVRFGADGRIDWEAQADELVPEGDLQTPRARPSPRTARSTSPPAARTGCSW